VAVLSTFSLTQLVVQQPELAHVLLKRLGGAALADVGHDLVVREGVKGEKGVRWKPEEGVKGGNEEPPPLEELLANQSPDLTTDDCIPEVLTDLLEYCRCFSKLWGGISSKDLVVLASFLKMRHLHEGDVVIQVFVP
jgi:hypothetical protein